MKLEPKHYHFIGIGGIGMSGLAELLVRQGYKVSGSDLTSNALTAKLQHLGVKFFQGHAPNNVSGSEIIVISSAIGLDNPELQAAQANRSAGSLPGPDVGRPYGRKKADCYCRYPW